VGLVDLFASTRAGQNRDGEVGQYICVCVCVCMYAYICVCVCLSIYQSIYLSIYMIRGGVSRYTCVDEGWTEQGR